MGRADGKGEAGEGKGRAAIADSAAASSECGREERKWEEESPFNESKWNPMVERYDFAILNSEPLPVNDWGIWTELPSRWIKPRWE